MLWNVQEQEQTSSCFWRDFSDAILLFGRKTSVAWRFFRNWKSKALPLPGHLDRLKMVHVDGQFKVSPNSFRIWFNFTKKTLLEFNFTKRLDFDRENHGCVTLSLYEHPRRPSTSEILTIFGLRSDKLEKCFLTGFWLDAILLLKNQRGLDFSEIEKIKLCLARTSRPTQGGPRW